MNTQPKLSGTNHINSQVLYEGADSNLSINNNNIIIESSNFYNSVTISIDKICTINVKHEYKTRVGDIIINIMLIIIAVMGVVELIASDKFFLLVVAMVMFTSNLFMNELMYPYRLMIVVDYRDIHFIRVKKKDLDRMIKLLESSRYRSRSKKSPLIKGLNLLE